MMAQARRDSVDTMLRSMSLRHFSSEKERGYYEALQAQIEFMHAAVIKEDSRQTLTKADQVTFCEHLVTFMVLWNVLRTQFKLSDEAERIVHARYVIPKNSELDRQWQTICERYTPFAIFAQDQAIDGVLDPEAFGEDGYAAYYTRAVLFRNLQDDFFRPFGRQHIDHMANGNAPKTRQVFDIDFVCFERQCADVIDAIFKKYPALSLLVKKTGEARQEGMATFFPESANRYSFTQPLTRTASTGFDRHSTTLALAQTNVDAGVGVGAGTGNHKEDEKESYRDPFADVIAVEFITALFARLAEFDFNDVLVLRKHKSNHYALIVAALIGVVGMMAVCPLIEIAFGKEILTLHNNDGEYDYHNILAVSSLGVIWTLLGAGLGALTQFGLSHMIYCCRTRNATKTPQSAIAVGTGDAISVPVGSGASREPLLTAGSPVEP